MFGEGHAGGDERLPHRRGIVPRVCGEVVAAMDARRASGIDAELSVAYVEVFGAQVGVLTQRMGVRALALLTRCAWYPIR